MNKREFLGVSMAMVGGCAGLGVAGAQAPRQPPFVLSVGAVHPITLPWVNLMSNQFLPEVSERAAQLDPRWTITWHEFYGGQIYKVNAALTSVSEGIVDIGWVQTATETSRLPLSQFSAVMPFATGDLRLALAVVNELNATDPDLLAEWDRQGLVLLGGVTTDTYHLFSREPLNRLADLQGRRLSVPSAVGLWLRNSGAVPVNGLLTTFYNDIQTGVSEGTVTIATGAVPLRIQEVAPHVALVDIGAMYGGGMVMNKGSFESLPSGMQRILREAGARYSVAVGELMAQRYQSSLETLMKAPGVNVTRWTEAERRRWALSLPNLAGEWVLRQRSPEAARRIVRAYMAGLRQRGARPLRDWDKEI